MICDLIDLTHKLYKTQQYHWYADVHRDPRGVHGDEGALLAREGVVEREGHGDAEGERGEDHAPIARGGSVRARGLSAGS